MQQGVVLLDADLQVLMFNAQAAGLLQAPKGAIERGLGAGQNVCQCTLACGSAAGRCLR
ncbi:hypothetical protein HFO39_32080 [Rhizobium leguminosarum]|nr:hypothetical protein [Rhizobium leguminosarum]